VEISLHDGPGHHQNHPVGTSLTRAVACGCRNDLTQATYGFSRDDIGSFLPAYLDKKVLEADPFATLDQKGTFRASCSRWEQESPGLLSRKGDDGAHGP
jgi:hypothetical protein